MKNKTIWIINQYASTPATGIGGRHYALATEMSKKGYNVYLICASFSHILKSPPELDTSFRVDDEGTFKFVWVKVPIYKSAHSAKRIINWGIFAYKLLKLKTVIEKQPDVIVYSSPSLIGFLGAKKLARAYGARLVFEVRDIWPLSLVELGGYSTRHPFICFLQWVEDKAYKTSDAVISNLKFSVEHMTSRGLDKAKFAWIPNGFSLSEHKGQCSLNQNAVSKLPKDKFLVGYTGTLGLANGLGHLIEAAEMLKDKADIAFVLVGDGRERENLARQVKNKQLSNVYMLGAIPKNEVQDALSHLDVCYIGLTRDPLFRFGVSPNKLFDYFYAGKPVIYAIDSGAYQPVKDAEAGLQIEPENPAAICDAVTSLYQLPIEERATMGENGKATVLYEYEYEQLATQFEQILFPKHNEKTN